VSTGNGSGQRSRILTGHSGQRALTGVRVGSADPLAEAGGHPPRGETVHCRAGRRHGRDRVAACVRGCRAKPRHRKLVVIRYQVPTRGARLGADPWRCSYAYCSSIARVRVRGFGSLCVPNNGDGLCDTSSGNAC